MKSLRVFCLCVALLAGAVAAEAGEWKDPLWLGHGGIGGWGEGKLGRAAWTQGAIVDGKVEFAVYG